VIYITININSTWVGTWKITLNITANIVRDDSLLPSVPSAWIFFKTTFSEDKIVNNCSDHVNVLL